jgi:hypothetical protein
MAMVARLMEAKDSTLDLTNMPNAFDIGTYLDADDLGEHKWSFSDRLGLMLSQNLRGIFAQFVIA